MLNFCSGDNDSEEDDENMDVDASKKDNEVAIALSSADALVKKSKKRQLAAPLEEDLADGLKELDMDCYDEEDEGLLFCSVLRLLFKAKE